MPVSDVEDTMLRMIALIVATALFVFSVDVWAGGSGTADTDNAPVFVLSNAL